MAIFTGELGLASVAPVDSPSPFIPELRILILLGQA